MGTSAVGLLRVVSSVLERQHRCFFTWLSPGGKASPRLEAMRFREIIKSRLIFADVVMNVSQFLVEFPPEVEVLPVCNCHPFSVAPSEGPP